MEISFNPEKLNNFFTISSSAKPNPPPLNVLPSALAGSWYPSSASELDKLFNHLLGKVPDSLAPLSPNVLLLPHAGYAYSARCAMHGIKLICNAKFTRVILLAPSHHGYFQDHLVAPQADQVSTPYGAIDIDHKALSDLAKVMPIEFNDSIHKNEHSAQIEYPMLQYALHNQFKLIPLIVGETTDDFSSLAAHVLASLMDSNTLLVISSDFTHYGRDFDFTPFAPEQAREKVEALDDGAWQYINQLDFNGFRRYIQDNRATICGHNPITIMLKMLPPNVQLIKLNYANSSDLSSDFKRFVCYLSAAGYAKWHTKEDRPSEDFLDNADKLKLLSIARRAIQYGLEHNAPCRTDRFDEEASEAMQKISACFVTLSMRNSGALRGCIGEISGYRMLYRAVASRAFDAAFRDSRFMQLNKSEFDSIDIEISVLTPPKPVNSYSNIVIGKHGMTISKNGLGAVFLPQVALEQGWTLEETLTHLCQKAGLNAHDWQSGASFTVFEAIVFNEKGLGRA